jgi:hypothetical protein
MLPERFANRNLDIGIKMQGKDDFNIASICNRAYGPANLRHTRTPVLAAVARDHQYPPTSETRCLKD